MFPDDNVLAKKKERKKTQKKVTHAYILSARAECALKQHCTIHMCAAFFVQEKRLTSPMVNNCSTISGNQSESNV